jgi:hypothetical protein
MVPAYLVVDQLVHKKAKGIQAKMRHILSFYPPRLAPQFLTRAHSQIKEGNKEGDLERDRERETMAVSIGGSTKLNLNPRMSMGIHGAVTRSRAQLYLPQMSFRCHCSLSSSPDLSNQTPLLQVYCFSLSLHSRSNCTIVLTPI